MPTEIEELHIGDVGTRILSTIVDESADPVDLSSATTINYLLRKPSGTISTLGATLFTDGTDGKIYFTTLSTTLDEAGFYKLQAYIETPTKQWHTDKVAFRVYPNLD